MADLSGKKINFAVRQMEAVDQLLDALDQLRALRREWDALSLGTTITDADLTGPVQHVAAADLVSAFVSHEALENLLTQGHYTNFFKLTL